MSCPTPPPPDLCLFTRGHLPKTARIPLLCSKTLFPCPQLTVILASSDLCLLLPSCPHRSLFLPPQPHPILTKPWGSPFPTLGSLSVGQQNHWPLR